MSQKNRHADDLRLVQLALANDPVARARFVERMACVPAILRARQKRAHLALSADDVAEVVQSTIAAVWSKLPSFLGQSTLETWAYGFCVNELRKWAERRGRRSNHVHEDGLEEGALGVYEADDPFDFDHVHHTIERLGPPVSSIIYLKHFDELTFDEIGRRMTMSPNTAKTHYYRGVQKLRELLRPYWRREQS